MATSSDPTPPISSFGRLRTGLGVLGLLAACGWLAVSHAPADEGLDAAAVDTRAVLAEADPTVSSGALLLDFVEPDDGEGGSEEAIAARVAELDADPDFDVAAAGRYSEGEHLFRVTGNATDRLAELLDDPLIEGVEPELLFELPELIPADTADAADGSDDRDAQKPGRFVPNDPMFKLQWHMEQIRAPEAWTKARGKGVVVAVIDTGVAWKDGHGVIGVPDLAGTEFVEGETFVDGATPEGLDDHAHGTHVAGTIAQTTDNGVGVTGVAFEATIMPLKVLSADGRGAVPGIANAIRYAADHGAQVINMSLGGPLPSSVLAKAIEHAHKKGVTVVCAAGNERRGRVGYPAANKHSIAVAAVDYGRQITFYSNYGKDIDVAAPGGDTRADKNGDGHPDGVLQNTIMVQRPRENDYLWFQGTSMASPHAAGVAALIVGAGVTNPDEVERVMKASAVHPSGAEWDKYYGAGIIDAAAAVDAARSGQAPERAAVLAPLFLLGLLGLGGVARAGAARVAWWLGAIGGAGLASGAFGIAPLSNLLLSGLGFGFAGIAAVALHSIALPAALALLLLGFKPLRGLLVGLTLGVTALLLHETVVLPTMLTALPGDGAVDRLWLGAQALIGLWLTRRLARL